ncbi:uncharacterized protein BT62DRAFT_983578 [Guyanagaster necrorhizus]|uniref:Uncharacterized protein n=1 Tax=Guyanagaster necrorhizus TaxID=856835 RepID=A0A9P7W500_9AGAR|nr:uncharacterized protein BT62DRAFT_983578 [Guyanagaster necrorhizus MCA 3950]KAG7452560.1 hypothetical protein BT62DRAFT_983578 [Guyanagaster necrorhizus MCA 3950]
MPSTSPADLEVELSHLLSDVRESNSRESWERISIVSHELANALRTKDEHHDIHTALGRTPLSQTLTGLLGLELHNVHSSIPEDFYAKPVVEILRVGANLCLDHDNNRGALLGAGFLQAIVSLLEGYAELIPPPPQTEPLPLSIDHLKIVRTAIGVLLNASLGFDAIKDKLISMQVAGTVLKLSASIYPPGSWQGTSSAEQTPERAHESWTIRSVLSNWAWRTITELQDGKDEKSRQVFSPDILPFLTPPLVAFMHPFTARLQTPFSPASQIYNTLVHSDFDVLEESCSLIESLSLDVEDVRLSLARGFYSPSEHNGVPCLGTILDFIEHGGYPASWRTSVVTTDGERNRMEKAFDICKAALVKAVVEVAGEDSKDELLWTDSDPAQPGGEFVSRMVGWIKRYVTFMNMAGKNASDPPRDDLVICASLSLGNLARREKHAKVLLSPPYTLALVLASSHLLSPTIDIKLKHGIIGLLKHMAQSSLSPDVHISLCEAGIVQSVSRSGVWDEKTDKMGEIVQLSAIGVVKHMCGANVESTFALVLPSPEPTGMSTGLSQIVSLLKRSETVSVKSEGTRVLVNVIKSLWSVDVPGAHNSIDDDATRQKQRKRQTAIQSVLTLECTSALASLVAHSAKYPLLVNEGVVALSLLSTQKAGRPLVLTALLAPLELPSPPPTEPPSASTSSNSDVSSPTLTTPSTRGQLPTPRSAAEMLVAVLRNLDNPVNFPVEVRINVCSLLWQVGRHKSGEDIPKLQEVVKPVLEQVIEDLPTPQGKEATLVAGAKKVLESWA